MPVRIISQYVTWYIKTTCYFLKIFLLYLSNSFNEYILLIMEWKQTCTHICTYILGECYAVATNKLQVLNQIYLFFSIFFAGYWPFGSVFCYIYSSFQGIAILVSSYTLVVISFERYMSILYPLRSVIRGGGGNLYCIVFVLWTMATLASIPNIIQTRHIQINKDNTSENIWVCTSGKHKSIWLEFSLYISYFQSTP